MDPYAPAAVVEAAATVPARLLEYRPGRCVALAPHAALELLDRPPLTPVPGAPYYCPGLVAWQDRQLPLVDLNVLLRAYPDAAAAPLSHVLVVAWQPAPRQPLQYGALCAPALVRGVQVADGQHCALPTDSDLWPHIARACFELDGTAVPVVDTTLLFGQAHG